MSHQVIYQDGTVCATGSTPDAAIAAFLREYGAHGSQWETFARSGYRVKVTAQ